MENDMNELSEFDNMIGRGVKYMSIGIFLILMSLVLSDCAEKQSRINLKRQELLSSTMIECAKENGRWIISEHSDYCLK